MADNGNLVGSAWYITADSRVSTVSASNAKVDLVVQYVSTGLVAMGAQANNRVYGKIGDYTGPTVRSDVGAVSVTGNETKTTVYNIQQTFTRRADDYYVNVYAEFTRVNTHAGTSTVQTQVKIPAADYNVPDEPKDVVAALNKSVSTTADITWTNTSTTVGKKEWSKVRVERKTDGIDAWDKMADSLLGSATGWSDSSLSENHRYYFRVRSENDGGVSNWAWASDYVYTKPAAATNIVLERNDENTATVTWTMNALYADSWYIERKQVLGTGDQTWVEIGTSTDASLSYFIDTELPAGDVYYRVRYENGYGYSDYLASTDCISNPVTPEAPTITRAKATVVQGSEQTIEWVPNHPDLSVQESAQILVTRTYGGTEESTTYTVPDESTVYTLANMQLGDYRVQVRTKGIVDNYGAWSAEVSFSVKNLPAVTILEPATGVTVLEAPIKVAWSCTSEQSITSAKLTVTNVTDGTQPFPTANVDAVGSIVLGSSAYPVDTGKTYKANLVAIAGGTSNSDETTFYTDFSTPPVPSAEVSPNSDELSCIVQVFEDSSGEYTDNDCTMELWRVVDGSMSLLTSGMYDGNAYTDYTPPLNMDYQYMVVFRASNDLTSTAYVDAYVESYGAAAMNFGDGYASIAKIEYDYTETENGSVGGESYYFAGVKGANGTLEPVYYSTNEMVWSCSASGVVLDDEWIPIWRKCFATEGPYIWRNPFGVRKCVSCEGSIDVSAESWKRWDVSLEMEGVHDG